MTCITGACDTDAWDTDACDAGAKITAVRKLTAKFAALMTSNKWVQIQKHMSTKSNLLSHNENKSAAPLIWNVAETNLCRPDTINALFTALYLRLVLTRATGWWRQMI